ncbi:MAG: hypothetical protein AAFR75_01990 [Pseudomonadota bacterium]
MTSAYFRQYTHNLTRVLMAEFVDDMQNGGGNATRSPRGHVTTTVDEIAHLLPPFPMITNSPDGLET